MTSVVESSGHEFIKKSVKRQVFFIWPLVIFICTNTCTIKFGHHFSKQSVSNLEVFKKCQWKKNRMIFDIPFKICLLLIFLVRKPSPLDRYRKEVLKSKMTSNMKTYWIIFWSGPLFAISSHVRFISENFVKIIKNLTELGFIVDIQSDYSHIEKFN